MLAVLITLTPGCPNEFIDYQKANVQIVVLPIIDVMTHWNSTLELLEHAYCSREFTLEWLPYPQFHDDQPLFTSQDEWTIVNCVMEVLRPFRYWTLWRSKRHTVTLHQVVTVYNNMFNRMEGVMRALAKKNTPLKEDLCFAVRFARHKLSKYYPKVTPTMGMLLISAHILEPIRKLKSFKQWDKGIHTDPEDKTSCTTRYHNAFRKHVENQYNAKHRSVLDNKHDSLQSSNFVPSSTASGSRRSSFDPYDLSTVDAEYLTPNNVAVTTPGVSYHAARRLTAARPHIYSPPDSQTHWVQIIRNLNVYNSDPMETSSTIWFLNITD